ncbi:MAG: ABC transporter ATP-binding protein [Rhodocyclaceae bacterium]|nr:ABC transporter ATP-binding protein [Rhodocyclaceae bacterium]
MTTSAIILNDVVKTYAGKGLRKRTTAVKGISLQVHQGEAFGFIGPNGAGKSSTIRMLVGLTRPTAGEIAIFGKSAIDPDVRIGVGYVPENPSLYDYLTPREILCMGMKLHRLPQGVVRENCDRWLTRLELLSVADVSIRTFSKGMMQRVAIAHALAIQPRLLILDEPLSGLDPVGRRDVVEILSEYKQGGGTLFFSSHVLHDVERLADRFGLIHQGELQSVQSPAELAGDEEVLVIRSAGNIAIPRMRLDGPGRWIGEIPRPELWEFLDVLRVSGHRIIELRPTLSLEMAFLKVVGRSEAVPTSLGHDNSNISDHGEANDPMS